ncbi:MAG: bifunctional DNA primase/polymerase, partial [Pseudonocardiaceae bacterium]
AARGWPIVPGTHPHRGRWYGRPGAAELGPIADDWPDAAITDPELALTVWTGRPYGVLLVCGQGVDVLELPAPTASTLRTVSRDGVGVPIAVVFPPPCWLVFVTSGAPLRPDLAALDVTLRGAGDWVAQAHVHGECRCGARVARSAPACLVRSRRGS